MCSMVPNHRLDYPWSEAMQGFCKETCPHDRDWQHCIGLCPEATTLACDEAHDRIGSRVVPNALFARVATAIPPAKGRRLRVIETINGVEEQVADFDLEEEERESFLPSWRSIGESRLQFLGK